MPCRLLCCLLLCGVVLVAGVVSAQSVTREGYDINFIGPPLADPVLQHSKETYVIFGCAYCHGVNLVPRGEATDLMRSPLVGADVNANLIGPLLRAGIPQTAKLSPMPQYSDLSDQQISDIARWIHYARQRGRYTELTDAWQASGNAAAGKTYFEQACSSCHSTDRDFANIGRKYDATALRAQILEPNALGSMLSYRVDRLRDTQTAAARQQHQTLLENYSTEQVTNLVAYLRSLN